MIAYPSPLETQALIDADLMSQIGQGRRVWKCNQCDLRAKDAGQVARHILNRHSD